MFLELKQNLDDNCLMFLLYTLTTTHVISTKITHKNHILLYSPLSVICIPVMATPRKLILPLIRLQKIHKVMNHIIKPEILQPSLIYVVLTIHNKNISPPQTMYPDTNRCPIHHRGRLTPLRRVKLTTLLQKTFRRTSLGNLEAVKTASQPSDFVQSLGFCPNVLYIPHYYHHNKQQLAQIKRNSTPANSTKHYLS